ncbi:MAG TPA: C45 family peptidase [Acetobacteraceae bacterium]|jgi:isopenicillin-N N-acyltransferase-like protein|nr:C45 family peptidase [Acetobacteraceae bacterium]
MPVTAFPLIDLSGPPRERGRRYGIAAAARIHRSAEIYLRALETLKLGSARVHELVDALVPIIERFEPAYLEEMRGIAEGAHCPLEHIVVVNARTELLAEARRAAEADGCTGAVVLPEASADGKLLHGQNWDWRAECAETGVVLRINREDGPTVLTFTEAGGLARCGMNSAGVALTANFLGSDRDGRTPGVPLVLLRRRALESTHFALGIQTIYATGKWVSNNIMLSHAGGAAVDIESAPDESFLIQPDQGLLVHANHFESPAALAKLRDTGLPSTPDSAYRAQRVRGHLAAKRGSVGIDDLKSAFFDDFASPYAVCRPPRPAATGDNLSATVMMIVMKPAEGWMEICPLPALNRTFTRYALIPSTATALAAE